MANFRPLPRDPVTGAIAPASFGDAVADQLGEAQRWRQPLAVLLAGVDRFSEANARWGRAKADDLLAAIARRIGAILPIDGLLARYRGDQFGALCRVASVEQAAALATRLQRRVSDRPFRVAGVDDAYFYTVSVGVVVSAAPATVRPHDLMLVAEDALRQAKDAGRNWIVVGGRAPGG